MKRTVTEDPGYVPDYTFSKRRFRKLLDITGRGDVRDVTVSGGSLTITMTRVRNQRTQYEISQGEFKARLGITDSRSVLIVHASVWSSKVQIDLAS